MARNDLQANSYQDRSIIDVDFEFFGLNADVDFKGVRTLLKQLLDADNEAVELTQLSDLLLSQADHVGTAVKCDGEETDPYAFISILNLNQHRGDEAVQQILKYLRSRTQDATISKALSLTDGSNIGLLFSERFINMPHQTVPPLYTMLQREMSLGGEAFKFTHILIVSKTYTEVQSTIDVEDDRPQKKKKQGAQTKDANEVFYFHPEDEIIEKHALAVISFDYQKQVDSGQSDSKRAFQDYGIKPQGRLILLEASKFDAAVKAVGEYLGST